MSASNMETTMTSKHSVAFAAALAGLLMASSLAQALPISQTGNAGAGLSKKEQGYTDCVAWCNAHNKTKTSRTVCGDNCYNTWKEPWLPDRNGVAVSTPLMQAVSSGWWLGSFSGHL